MRKTPGPTEPPRPLRWGILGPGRIAHKFVGDLQASGAGVAVACGSRSTDRARAFAAEFRLPKAYGSYGELLRDQEVEAVYVATPHSCHALDTVAALRAGKHVLCEKPLAVNSFEVKEMFAEAEKAGRVLMEGLWTFHLPALALVRRWLDEGAVGPVRFIDAEFGFPAPALPETHRLLDPRLAGGALLDVGVYPVALAQWAAGNRPPKIRAAAVEGPTGVDQTTSVLLEWPGGVQANLRCSIAHQQQRPAVIHGTEGTITLTEFWRCPTATLENRQGRTVFQDSRTTWGYEGEVRAFTAAVRQGLTEEPVVNRAFSLRLAATLDAVRRQIGLRYPADLAVSPEGRPRS